MLTFLAIKSNHSPISGKPRQKEWHVKRRRSAWESAEGEKLSFFLTGNWWQISLGSRLIWTDFLVSWQNTKFSELKGRTNAGFLHWFTSTGEARERHGEFGRPERRSEQQAETIAGSLRASAVLKALMPGSLAPTHVAVFLLREHGTLIFISRNPFRQGPLRSFSFSIYPIFVLQYHVCFLLRVYCRNFCLNTLKQSLSHGNEAVLGKSWLTLSNWPALFASTLSRWRCRVNLTRQMSFWVADM